MSKEQDLTIFWVTNRIVFILPFFPLAMLSGYWYALVLPVPVFWPTIVPESRWLIRNRPIFKYWYISTFIVLLVLVPYYKYSLSSELVSALYIFSISSFIFSFSWLLVCGQNAALEFHSERSHEI